MKLRRFLAGLLVFLSLFCWNAEILQPTCFTTACAEKIIVNGAEVTAYVTSSSANIRKKATTNSNIVTTLKRGTKLYVTGSVETAKGTWYKIRTENGKTGYVSGRLISASAPSSSSSRSGSGTSGSGSSAASTYVDQPSQSRTVYVSRTGECYHSRANCSGMKSPLKMTEREAISRGRRPCKKCW